MQTDFFSGSAPFMRRDLLILLACVGAWVLLEHTGSSGRAVGFLTGLCVFLAHEWGHVLGARISGARVRFSRDWFLPFLFNFDASGHTRAQFLHTAHGGFLVTALALAAIWLVPADSTAVVTARWSITALASATVIFEFPIYFWVAAGRRPPQIQLVRER